MLVRAFVFIYGDLNLPPKTPQKLGSAIKFASMCIVGSQAQSALSGRLDLRLLRSASGAAADPVGVERVGVGVTSERLAWRLRSHGIGIRPGRNTALAEL